MYTSYSGHPENTLVMRKWRRVSTKKFWTLLKNASSIGRNVQPGKRLRQSPTSASRPPLPAEFQARVTTTYNHFRDLKEGSCEEALATVQDAHWQTFVATTLLEEKVERLNHSGSQGHQCLGSHRWSGSHRYRRSLLASCPSPVPQVASCQRALSGKLSCPGHLGWDSWLLLPSHPQKVAHRGMKALGSLIH